MKCIPKAIMKSAVLVLSFALGVLAKDNLHFQPIVGGISGSASISRFWDCCGSRCSGFKNCAQDGKTAAASGSRDVCIGDSKTDDAFICSNNQPIIVNDTLAYAFGKLVYDAVDEVCCTCLQLSFNGANKDKTVIVQVSSSDYNLGMSDEVSIEIPGGGVGQNYAGCMAQWDTPINGWGNLYRGVSTREECLSLLPEDLQAGCVFRFDFLNDMRVEKGTYTQVTCPKELSDISGCSA